ncbi:MAG: hypothetical protein OYL41_11050 [Acidobacteriota bacterium]|nr:hypothetical protein [Acidobacteriota bacterium]
MMRYAGPALVDYFEDSRTRLIIPITAPFGARTSHSGSSGFPKA